MYVCVRVRLYVCVSGFEVLSQAKYAERVRYWFYGTTRCSQFFYELNSERLRSREERGSRPVFFCWNSSCHSHTKNNNNHFVFRLFCMCICAYHNSRIGYSEIEIWEIKLKENIEHQVKWTSSEISEFSIWVSVSGKQTKPEKDCQLLVILCEFIISQIKKRPKEFSEQTWKFSANRASECWDSD